jgi:hypothetical protein
MKLQDDLKKILDNNTVANINLTQTSINVTPGHEAKVVDTTKLLKDVERYIIGYAAIVIGNSRTVMPGDKTDPSDIKVFNAQNLLQNEQRKRERSMRHG